MSVRCSACGAPHHLQARFCPGCGRPLAPGQPGALVPQWQPGAQLAGGRYTIQRELSRGGMGTIYLATDHATFDRPVVLKVLLDYFDTSDPQAVRAAQQRFVAEARTLAHLRHPAIAQIYAFFPEGPHNVIVMEYIEGHDLQQGLSTRDPVTGKIVPGAAYPIPQVLRWGVLLCEVLEYLASQRPAPVIHHDIKPANLLVGANGGGLRLVDFGTARARLARQAGGGVGLQQSSIYGTQGYAPPEQYRGLSEPRSDLYALAATLYHLATDDDPGLHPFVFPLLPQLGTLGQALAAALEHDVQRRPGAADLGRALAAILAQRPAAPLLQTPDGSHVATRAELARWCEHHWEIARAWMRSTLPAQIGAIWGDQQLAADVQAASRYTGPDRDDRGDAGLGQLLRLLDQQFPQPRVTVSPARLDQGVMTLLQARDSRELYLRVTNTGRGYAEVSLVLDHLLGCTGPQTLGLRPGASGQFRLFRRAGPPPPAPTGLRTLRLLVAHGSPIEVPFTATYVMEAPDGSRFSAIAELVQWCLDHWELAVAWMADRETDTFFRQIVLWGDEPFQRRMRVIMNNIANRHDPRVELDRTLALLDPQGYGARRAALSVDPPLVTLVERATRPLVIQLANRGTRWAALTPELPPWLHAEPRPLVLGPGQRGSMRLRLDPLRPPPQLPCRAQIDFFDHPRSHTALAVQVEVLPVARGW
ncbi:MAG: hypothetical protein OHK0015_07920 [Chloroflexi bacterium OHK40]